ncbi:MAG: hypothetical protein QOI04_1477 [Verrucomicrobiota bacterium]|jgi:hypothetical protein
MSILCPSIQAQTPSNDDTIRVTVAIAADGSRTTYQSDRANHKATATTTDPDGHLREKINYELDQAGHYVSGQSFGADGQFRFKALYKYDATGRIAEERQLAKNDSLQRKIVYSYDAAGKPTGMSIFDAAGKLLSRTGAAVASPTPTPSSKKTKNPGSR